MTRTLALTFSLVAAACGDNQRTAPDATTPDAASKPRAVVVSGDFTPGATGVMSVLDLEAMEVQQRVAPNSAVGSDPMLRKLGDELFAINRTDGNSITIFDATTLKVKEQLATGAGSNPYDVAVGPAGKLFVPAWDTAGVVVLTRGTTVQTLIDLSALDPDGLPNCESAYTVGNEVYVACQLLDNTTYQPRGPGKIVVIDAATNAVKTMFDLANVNPLGLIEKLPDDVLGGDLVVPTVKFVNFLPDLTVGCVERIKTGPAPGANGCLATNLALKGFVARLDVQRVGEELYQWMVVSNGKTGPEARSNLQGFDLKTLVLWPAPISAETELLVDGVVCPNDLVVVADQTMAANGLRVYEGGAQKTSAPLPIGLKPTSSHGLVCY
jgi:hypothetical protein